jgi:argininosuccinate lyase
MKDKTAMQDFLENIRNKKNTISRDVQNGHGHYYVIRIFEILEAECFSKLEKEKEQIREAYYRGVRDEWEGAGKDFEDYYKQTYEK